MKIKKEQKIGTYMSTDKNGKVTGPHDAKSDLFIPNGTFVGVTGTAAGKGGVEIHYNLNFEIHGCYQVPKLLATTPPGLSPTLQWRSGCQVERA